MQLLNTEKMTVTDAGHLPIVKAYAEKIGLVQTIDQMVGSQMELNPGLAVLAMVLDTLSGRTPLYRLAEFFEEKDTELLLGVAVERNIPILGATTDGNASDKMINNELLTNVSKYMADHGLEPGAYVYVADSAVVTEDNLKKIQDNNTQLLTRLPATYNECGRVIAEAVNSNHWIKIGPLADEAQRGNRPVARYRAYEGTVELYDKTYRAVVVHSSAHDKRRHKRIDRLLQQDRKQLEGHCKQAMSTTYYCRKDAEVAGEKLIRKSNNSYHRIQVDIKEVPKYGRGRPKAGKPRQILCCEYHLTATIKEAPEKINPLRQEAGCFVLLTTLIDQQEKWPARELLTLYKSQIGIEKNFSFLKDPAIVNSIFFKKAERIEVLGLILLIALLIRRLMERSMRQYVEINDCTLPGWIRRQTKKPTSFMMTTKFSSVMVITIGRHRQLVKSLKPAQIEYLKALGVTADIFTVP